MIATLLFTLIPTVLAHAGLATTDMGLAACLGAAFLAMLVWAEEPTRKHGAIFGFCMALALLSKFTTLGFFPVGAAIALAFYLAAERPGMERLKQLAKERAASFGIAVGVCLLHRVGGLLLLVRQSAFLECEPAGLGILRRHTRGAAAQHGRPSGLAAG